MESPSTPIGNINLIYHENKTAFLCSRSLPYEFRPALVNWLNRLDARKDCVMCGNLQKIENEVLQGLIERGIPTIVVLDRPYPESWPTYMMQGVGDQKLLIITLVDFTVPWIDKYVMAEMRNKYMIANAKRIVLGFCRPGGIIESQLQGIDKEVIRLNKYNPLNDPRNVQKNCI